MLSDAKNSTKGRAVDSLDHGGEEVEIVEAVPCGCCAAIDR
jgi:hypothetical protein